MAYLDVWKGVPGPPFPADVEVVAALAVAGVPPLAATVADRHPRPPLGPPIRAVVGPSRAPVCHFSPGRVR